MSTQSDIKTALETAGTMAVASAGALPPPANIVAGIIGAALESASGLIDQGQTPEQIIAAMHRARKIDTSAEDAAVDALVAAKPSSAIDAVALVAAAAKTLRSAMLPEPAAGFHPAVEAAIKVLVDHHDPQPA